MKATKLSLAIASLIGAGFAGQALALDLYVDNKTQQIFAEPGPNRSKLGSFEKVEDTAAQKAELAQIKEEMALKTNEIKALDEHVKDPKFGELQINEKGIKFESKDGNFDMSINGRMQIDSQSNISGMNDIPNNATGTNQLADGANIRRARLGAEGSYFKDFLYKFEFDFTRGNGSLASGLTDAYVAWKGYDPLLVQVGQFKEPFSLEEATSNRYLTFIERNMAVNSFSDNDNAYKVGMALGYAQPRWQVKGALQTESTGQGGASSSTSSSSANGNTNRSNGQGDTGWGVVGRATGLPWYEDKTKFLHLGASGSSRKINQTSGQGGIFFASALNTNVDRTFLLRTPNMLADRVNRYAVEQAFVYGPFSTQAEYIQTNVSNINNSSNTFDGYYAYASYFLTGESRAYKASTGAWDRIKPKQNFSTKGGLGAWEVAAGYDYLNLTHINGTSNNITGGTASTAKFGLNWYPNSHVRLMANFIHALNINNSGVATVNAPAINPSVYNNRNFDVVEMRAQVDF